jgi:hypothetical protein
MAITSRPKKGRFHSSGPRRVSGAGRQLFCLVIKFQKEIKLRESFPDKAGNGG